MRQSELAAALSEKDRQLARQASQEKDLLSAAAMREFQDLKGEIARLTSSLTQLQTSARSQDGFLGLYSQRTTEDVALNTRSDFES